MSFIEQFNYNRDGLTQGDIVGFTGAPIYGSSISFTATNSSWRGSDYYQFVMANGVNSIKAEMDFTFQGNKDDIKSILRRIENATTGTITGDIAFSGTEDCINFGESKNKVQLNLDTAYYKNFSGSQISDYNIKHISSDVYELNVSLFNNRVSPILNNGIGFIADRTVSISDSSFLKFDVATGSTGTANSKVFNNYFYLTDSRGSTITPSNVSGLATYTGIAENATRTFFFEPDQQVSIPISHSTRVNQFKNSFHQQLNISRNQNRIDELNLKFTNRGERETYSILHFLESHLGYKTFVYKYDDDIIKQNRVFYCPQWRHTFNYKDSNTIEAKFIEIIAPVTPEF
jgi:phage-related protein